MARLNMFVCNKGYIKYEFLEERCTQVNVSPLKRGGCIQEDLR